MPRLPMFSALQVGGEPELKTMGSPELTLLTPVPAPPLPLSLSLHLPFPDSLSLLVPPPVSSTLLPILGLLISIQVLRLFQPQAWRGPDLSSPADPYTSPGCPRVGLTIEPRLAWYLRSSCLGCPRAGFTRVNPTPTLLSLSFFFSNLQPLSPLSRKQAAWQVSKPPPGWPGAPPHASPSPSLHPSRGSQSRVQKTHPSALVQMYTLWEDTEVPVAMRCRHLL